MSKMRKIIGWLLKLPLIFFVVSISIVLFLSVVWAIQEKRPELPIIIIVIGVLIIAYVLYSEGERLLMEDKHNAK